MPNVAFIDFETRSDVDLKKCGVDVYAESPNTSVLTLCWAFDDGPVMSDRDADVGALFNHVASGGTVVAHNARFEFCIWHMMTKRDAWPVLKPEQMRCTMASAQALSLPGALEKVAQVLRLGVEKDTAGAAVMRKMCKPRKPRKHEPAGALLWHESPEDLATLIAYCKTDVEVERRIYQTIGELPPNEQKVWLLDQKINNRGIYIDRSSCMTLAHATFHEKTRLNAAMYKATKGAVLTPTSTKALLAWLQGNGCGLTNLRKTTVANALKDTFEREDIRTALELRQEAAKASTAKIAAMMNGASGDGRARGLFAYHGAITGRWAGRRIQAHNMPRTPDDFEVKDAENTIDWLSRPNGTLGVRLEYESVMSAVSWSLRSLIKAAPGNRLFAADYSNIEGRVLAWLAGEEWKLQAFRDFDAGTGADLYKLAYSKSFGVRIEDVTKAMRLIGKVQELALGYQGGHGAFLSMAGNYNIDLNEIATAVRKAVSAERWLDANKQYWGNASEAAEEILADRRAALEIAGFDDTDEDPLDVEAIMRELATAKRHGLGVEVWSAVRIIVDGWRGAHQATAMFWKTLERAAIAAVEAPGLITNAGPHIKFRVNGDFLLCRLPSGRCLAYPYPRVAWEDSPFVDDDGKPVRVKRLRTMGLDRIRNTWGSQAPYGGLLAENVTQAVARDILAEAMLRLDAAGYDVVMHVHDEIVSEAELNSAQSLNEFVSIISTVPHWAAGLPVATDQWEGERYRK